MKIYILRHEDRTMDATFFAPLTEDGLNNSVKLIPLLKMCKINKIYSSPFIRTLQTIHPYAKQCDLNINIDYSLGEIQHPLIIPQKSYQITLPLYLSKSFNFNDKYKSIICPNEYTYPETEKNVEERVKKFIFKLINDEFKSKYGNRQVPNIPKTWNMSCKIGRGGNKKEHYTYYFSGPSDNLVEVMNSINQFYQGFDYTLI